jgi:POT family proton-dependent oligopeptide transporter
VSSPAVAAANPDRWPPQIKYIVGNEAAERFSYYGMKSILALYITKSLMQADDRAAQITHLFGFANYFMPLLGAWVSDRFWGRYHTILWVSLFYCLGHGVLALADVFPAGAVDSKLLCLYFGLGLIAFGSGGIKPCVSAFMGDQFQANQSHLMRKAYGLFYFSVNFGALFAFVLIPWIARTAGYGWAFGVPGIFMGVATLIFWLGTRHYVRKPPARETKAAGFVPVFLAAFRGQQGFNLPAAFSILSTIVLPLLAIVGLAIVSLRHEPTPAVKLLGKLSLGCVGLWYLLVIAACFLRMNELPDSFWNAAKKRFSEADITAARSVAPILCVFAFVPAFWALFEQSNSTWVLQGAKMVAWQVGRFTIGAEEMQSMNPLLVMLLVPLLNWGAYPALERLGLRVTALRRMAVGLVLTAASYLLVGWLQTRIEAGEAVSVLWQTVPYIVLTTGEVLVSTTGLEFAFTQAAPTMKSTVMSFWYMTVAFGHLCVAAITTIFGGDGGSSSVSAQRFFLYAGLTFAVSALFIVVAVFYRYRDSAPATPGKS